MRKIRMGMVGGGKGAFIGAIHRIAAQLDNQIELVCGAFSSDPDNAISSGKSLYLDEDRCYRSYQEMFEKESKLSDDKRMPCCFPCRNRNAGGYQLSEEPGSR